MRDFLLLYFEDRLEEELDILLSHDFVDEDSNITVTPLSTCPDLIGVFVISFSVSTLCPIGEQSIAADWAIHLILDSKMATA